MPTAGWGNYGGFGRANERGGHGRLRFLLAIADHLTAGGRSQLRQFVQGSVHLPARAGFEFDADQKHAFRPFGRG